MAYSTEHGPRADMPGAVQVPASLTRMLASTTVALLAAPTSSSEVALDRTARKSPGREVGIGGPPARRLRSA